MPDVDLEMIESARLALKQERAENARLRTEKEELREALRWIRDYHPQRWSDGDIGESMRTVARSALTPPPGEEDERG